MVNELISALRQDWKPAPVGPDEQEFSDDDALAHTECQFFVKNAALGACGSKIVAMKFHLLDSADHRLIACGRVLLSECDPAGSILPDMSVLCKFCLTKRPELFH